MKSTALRVAAIALTTLSILGSPLYDANVNQSALLGHAVVYAAEVQVKVMLDGQEVHFAVPPVEKDGTLMFPFEDLLTALGVEVGWNSGTAVVSGEFNGSKVEISLNDLSYWINRKRQETPSELAPYVENGRTYVSFDLVMSAFGLTVNWEEPVNTLYILPPRNSSSTLASVPVPQLSDTSITPSTQSQVELIPLKGNLYIKDSETLAMLSTKYGINFENNNLYYRWIWRQLTPEQQAEGEHLYNKYWGDNSGLTDEQIVLKSAFVCKNYRSDAELVTVSAPLPGPGVYAAVTKKGAALGSGANARYETEVIGWLTPDEVTAKISSLRDKYPDGSQSGGCNPFAAQIMCEIFGYGGNGQGTDLFGGCWGYQNLNTALIRPGDVIHTLTATGAGHYFIVVELNGDGTYTCLDGNVNGGKVMWGIERKLSDLGSKDYPTYTVYTRYSDLYPGN